MKLYTGNNNGEYNFVMAYPAIEEFALASLGYLWLYKIADTTDGINAKRISTDNLNVNTKNIDRFCENEYQKKYFLEYPDNLYVKKAKNLYHKIRMERDEMWWD